MRSHHPQAAPRSLAGLSGVNFFIADMMTGFGPFVTVYLAANGWRADDIGVALSVGTFAAVLAQLPAGALVDAIHRRRMIATIAIIAISCAAVALALLPQRWPVFAVQAAQGIAAAIVTPAIAAITLTLSDQERLGERLGSNVRFKALGSMLTAVLMGAIGSRFSNGAVFFVSAAFGGLALGALWLIRSDDLDEGDIRTTHPTALHPRKRAAPMRRRRSLWRDPPLMIFAACAFAFQLCNAALFPFAIAEIARAGDHDTDLYLSAALVASQAVAALISPLVGRQAQARGRRIVLLAGFAMLPLRALLYVVWLDPVSLVAFHVLDGISAAVFGVMVPLVIADITHAGGRFNLAMGVVGFIMTIGAALSTLGAGFVAQSIGLTAAFLALGLAGVAGCALVGLAMPETGHLARRAAPSKDAMIHAA